MTIEQELRLSYYREVAEIAPAHAVYLVQNVQTGKFYVKKCLTVYNAGIYRYLLEHPVRHTPRMELVEEADGILIIVEEFIPGDTLEEILEREGTLPAEKVCEITVQLCRILKEFHSCTPAIVNRDIKPANIKITPDGVVKLLDLNAAKWSRNEEKDTVLLGTQGYAAPEQYGFGASSVQTDIYAVGVLMNEMLVGTLPNQRLAEGALGEIIRKCVAMDPGDRFPRVTELQAALEAQTSRRTRGGAGANSHWRRFLPPGFRRNNAMQWLLAALGYAMLFDVGLGLEVEQAGPLELVLNRVIFTCSALCIVLFDGNYLGVQQHFVLTRQKQHWLRWAGMLLIDAVILLLGIVLLDLLVTLFVH